jgi:hypothetical protein
MQIVTDSVRLPGYEHHHLSVFRMPDEARSAVVRAPVENDETSKKINKNKSNVEHDSDGPSLFAERRASSNHASRGCCEYFLTILAASSGKS